VPKIKISGVIIPNDWQDVYDWFGIDATSPKKVISVLTGLSGEAVDVEISSGGGSVYAGSEIYSALKDYAGNVVVKIFGIAASAASVIAMAGTRVMIAPTAQIMIHNVSSSIYGDYRDLQQEAAVLENYNKSMANAYQLKTGIDQAELLDMMDRETWLNAQQAKEMGFADEIMFDQQNVLIASAGPATMLPAAVINKVKNLLRDSNNKNDVLAENERLALLKLRGKVE